MYHVSANGRADGGDKTSGILSERSLTFCEKGPVKAAHPRPEVTGSRWWGRESEGVTSLITGVKGQDGRDGCSVTKDEREKRGGRERERERKSTGKWQRRMEDDDTTQAWEIAEPKSPVACKKISVPFERPGLPIAGGPGRGTEAPAPGQTCCLRPGSRLRQSKAER